MMRSDIIAISQPAVNAAVDRAMHRLDPEAFHANRLRFGATCPLCPNALEQFAERMGELMDGDELKRQFGGYLERLRADAED